jgi:ubiquinone/menaquinone biosynthesis C-methylase UbiE
VHRVSQCDISDFPPSELRIRSTGRQDAEWFRSSGGLVVEAISEYLSNINRSLSDCTHIYEFGCGCGRITVPLTDIVSPASVTATDTDSQAIEWLDARLPEARIETNGVLPPLRFPDNSFDLIIVFGVFRHIPEDHKSPWLAEFARVCAPDGVVFLDPD